MVSLREDSGGGWFCTCQAGFGSRWRGPGLIPGWHPMWAGWHRFWWGRHAGHHPLRPFSHTGRLGVPRGRGAWPISQAGAPAGGWAGCRSGRPEYRCLPHPRTAWSENSSPHGAVPGRGSLSPRATPHLRGSCAEDRPSSPLLGICGGGQKPHTL